MNVFPKPKCNPNANALKVKMYKKKKKTKTMILFLLQQKYQILHTIGRPLNIDLDKNSKSRKVWETDLGGPPKV